MNPYFNFEIEKFDIKSSDLTKLEEMIDNFLKKSENDPHLMMMYSANKGKVLNTMVQSIRTNISFNDADNILLSADSFSRPELLINISRILSKEDWLLLFRENWTTCDSCSLYHNEFRKILKTYSIEEIRNLTHQDYDVEFYDSLPEEITIYRGTFIDERFCKGLSWSTEESVAIKFMEGYKSFKNGGPMMMRYRFNMDDQKFNLLKDISLKGVTVLSKVVNKKDIFVNTSRDEYEILVLGE